MMLALGLSGSGAFNGSNNQLTSFMGLSNSMDFAGGKLFGSFYWGKSNGISNETWYDSISFKPLLICFWSWILKIFNFL